MIGSIERIEQPSGPLSRLGKEKGEHVGKRFQRAQLDHLPSVADCSTRNNKSESRSETTGTVRAVVFCGGRPLAADRREEDAKVIL